MQINDVGKFVGRYCQVVAWVLLGWIIYSAIFYDTFNLDLTFILMFMVARPLMRHSKRARKWTLVLCGLWIVMILGVLAGTLAAGTEGTEVTYGNMSKQEPSELEIVVVSLILLAVFAVPMVLLLTPQAKREFGVWPSL